MLCHCRAPIHGKGGNFVSSVLMCKRRDTCPWWALVPCRHTTIRLLLSTSKKDNLSFSRNPEQTLLVHTRHRFDIPNSDRQILKGEKKWNGIHAPILHSSSEQLKQTGGSHGIFLSGSLVLREFLTEPQDRPDGRAGDQEMPKAVVTTGAKPA